MDTPTKPRVKSLGAKLRASYPAATEAQLNEMLAAAETGGADWVKAVAAPLVGSNEYAPPGQRWQPEPGDVDVNDAPPENLGGKTTVESGARQDLRAPHDPETETDEEVELPDAASAIWL